MKALLMLTCLLGVFTQQTLGQVLDDFSDGDFTSNPSWNGTASTFVVNASHQLQLGNSVAATSYLSVPLALQTDEIITWSFYIRQNFSGSTSNFSRVYLMSDQPDLTSGLNGYYLQFGEGGSNDAISLYRQTGLTQTFICRGTAKAIATAFSIRVKVTRTPSGAWEVFADYAGGANFVSEATATDNVVDQSSYFGVRCTYTVTNATKFFYDDFTIETHPVPDLIPPEVSAVNVISSTILEVVFSESLDPQTAENENNFLTMDMTPSSAVLQADLHTVRLEFDQSFTNGIAQNLAVKNIDDPSGNTMMPSDHAFLFFKSGVPAGHDVIITEIMADPSPPVGLAEYEFIEIFNRSPEPFDLGNWKITDGSSTGVLSSAILLPGEYVILSSPISSLAWSGYGKTIGIPSFPSLNNSGDLLKLIDAQGRTIDSLKYSVAWYHSGDKQDGGWTLERIDGENFCVDASDNWTASQDSSGGTPGKQNSVNAVIADHDGPTLLSATIADPDHVILSFNEKLDANTSITSFTMIPAEIISVSFSDATRTRIMLTTNEAMDSTDTYVLRCVNVLDCSGNPVQEAFSTATIKLDNTVPAILSVEARSSSEAVIVFSKKLRAADANDVHHYLLNAFEEPVNATLQSDLRTVILSFEDPFVNGVEDIITVNDIGDLDGNLLVTAEQRFMFFQGGVSSYKSVIVTEIMADPSPPVGLPEVEFVELYNRSDAPFDLKNWSITDESVTGIFPSYILLPGHYVIVCASASLNKLSPLGETIGITPFPSWNNTGDAVVVKDAGQITIDSVSYSDQWYKDSDKHDGGWSLELIDPENVCSDSENWAASEDDAGGTPGKSNSILASRPDLTGPQLVSVFPLSPLLLQVVFNERLDHRLPPPTSFHFVPDAEAAEVKFADASLTSYLVTMTAPLNGGTKYHLTVSDIFDCPGNSIEQDLNQRDFALPEPADSLDLVINEILFNPRPTGVDFVEIYNTSSKYINLKNWTLTNAQGTGKIIAAEDLLIAPATYLVLTENSNVLKGEYLSGKEETFVEMAMPSLPDDEGTVMLRDDHQKIIDAFSYSEKMHSPFISDGEGVSLERISFKTATDLAQNWKSASSTAGFATPGYVNSNSRVSGATDGSVRIEPEIFMPQYGQPDFTQIRYSFDQGGYVATVRILDAQGREIKKLANSELLGNEGFFRWDGDQENGSQARTGAYMVWFEIVDAEGMVKSFRKRVVVAEKF